MYQENKQTVTAYQKKNQKSVQVTSGAKSLNLSMEESIFDFDLLSGIEMSDQSRQSILTKQHFPRSMVGIVESAARIDFVSHGKDEAANANRLQQIVLNIRFLWDSTDKNFVRIDPEIGDVNYDKISIRFSLPTRHQAKLKKAHVDNFLGTYIACPEHDPEKWRVKERNEKKKQDEDKIKRYLDKYAKEQAGKV